MCDQISSNQLYKAKVRIYRDVRSVNRNLSSLAVNGPAVGIHSNRLVTFCHNTILTAKGTGICRVQLCVTYTQCDRPDDERCVTKPSV